MSGSEKKDYIGFHTRKFYPFSNFASFSVRWREREWMTSEHAYQAAKFLDDYPDIAAEIHQARSAYEAKKIARENKHKVPDSFYDDNLEIMRDICRAKLNQHEYIQKKLLQTKGKKLVEDSPDDDFWGWGPDKDGKNMLGKIWMELRDDLKE
jgi:ribA/ribD-fused uncharacterized protein